METIIEKNTIPCLQGGGELGAITRKFEWSQSSIGIPENWPQSLQATLAILLHSAFPMFLFWGEDLICFYNDAFRPSLGQEGKHPAVGKKGREVWPEIWDFIGPEIEKVMTTGEPSWYENQLVPIYRNGHLEEVYWTFSYSPAYDDDGRIKGMLAVCTETTDKVQYRKNLEESKDLLSFAIEAAELATWDLNPLTNQFIANERYTEWFGIVANEPTSNDLALAVIAEEDRERVLAAYTKAMIHDSGNKYDIEYTIRPENRPERILRAKGKAYFNEEKIAYRFTGTLQDVTEQVRATKALVESEERFRTLADQSPMIVFTLEPNDAASVSYFNKTWLDYTGQSLEEALGRAWDGIVHPDDVADVMDIYAPAFNNRTSYTLPAIRLKSASGEYRWHLFKANPRYLSNGEFIGFVGVGIDIHEQKLAEAEKQKLVAIIEASQEFIGLANVDGSIAFANPAALHMLGWQQITGKTIADCVYPDDRELAATYLATLLEKGDFSHEIRFLNEQTGEPFWVEWNAFTIRDPETGQLSGLATVSSHIGHRREAEEALRQSEYRIRSLVESAPFPIGVYVGREMRIAWANQTILDIWGKGNDVIGKLYTQILPELENQQIFDQLDTVFTTGEPFHAQNQRVDIEVEGKLRTFYFNYSFTPLFDAAGAVYGVMNTAADVTDLNLAKQKSEESEANLRSIILQAPVAMCIFRGRDFVIEIANKNMIEFWGKTEEGVLNKPIFEAVPEARSQGYEELMNRVLITGQSFSASELPVTLPRNGVVETVFINFAYEPIRESDGTISGIIAMAIDVTDHVLSRKKIEESERELQIRVAERTAELESQKNLLDNILTNSSNGISVTEMIRDEQGRIVDAVTIMANEAAVRYTGLPREIYLTKTAVELDPDILESPYGQVCLKTLEDGTPALIQYYLDITGRWLELTISKMDDDHLIHIFTDVTPIKEAQLQLEKTVEELRRSNANLEEFAYAASHDLKEPIRKIHFFSDRIKTSLLDRMNQEEKRAFDRMEIASKRMSTLIDDLLTYSQVSIQPKMLEEINMNHVISMVMEDLDLEIEEKNAELVVEPLLPALGHQRQLRQAFQNLIGNALKDSQPGKPPVIHIRSEVKPGKAIGLSLSQTDQQKNFHVYTVQDNGIGFEQKDASRIFNVFTRLHGNTEYRGTGVGLSIVRKVIENHHGYVEAESSPGEGATFRIYLPAI